MSRFQHQLLHAPRGMDSASDPGSLPEDTARLLLNVASNKLGRLTIPQYLSDLGDAAVPALVDGLFMYRDRLGAPGDRLLLIQNGRLYTAFLRRTSVNADPRYFTWTALSWSLVVSTGNPSYTDRTFDIGQRVRAVQFEDEVIFVQEDGTRPLRYNGTNLFFLGIQAPGTFTGSVASGGALTANSVYSYWLTFEDEKGRESSPTRIFADVTTTGANKKTNLSFTTSTDAQVLKYNLYRTLAGGSVGYYVTQFNPATSYTDSAADTTLNQARAVPLAGQNNPPTFASIIATHKGRLILNSSDHPGEIQISNQDRPTQFAAAPDPRFPDDGVTMLIGSDQGDPVTGLFSFGSLLAIWKQGSFGALWGDTVSGPEPFTFRPLIERGCTAPDSLVRCDNEVWFKSDDGVYRVSYADGFLMHKMSSQLDNFFKAFSVQAPDEQGLPTDFPFVAYRAPHALAWYWQNRYTLVIPPYHYVFDFTTGAWHLQPVVDGAQDEFSYGAACVYSMERETSVVVFARRVQKVPGPLPTITDTPALFMHTFFDPTGGAQPTRQTLHAQFRPFDGAGLARTRYKQAYRLTIYGTADIKNSRSMAVRMDCDGDTREYPIDLSDPNDLKWRLWQQQGILVQQEFGPDRTGFLLSPSLVGEIANPDITDWKLEYLLLA